MAVNGFALAGLAGGSIFLYAAIKGKSILATIQSIVQGKSPATVPATNTINPNAVSTSAAASGSSGGVNAPGSGVQSATSVPIGNTSVSANQNSSASQLQAYAFSQFGQYGWTTANEQPLIDLWNGESGWRWNATNPSSGAYGIPQSLPADKMAAAGSDWKTNPETQIRWGLSYIHSVYGNPAHCYQVWLSRNPHWY